MRGCVPLLATAFLLSLSYTATPGESRFVPNIVGGVEAKKGEFPWTVLIQISTDLKDDSNPRNKFIGPADGICVGTIFSSIHIITAAHCVYEFQSQDLKVLAGAHNISIKEPSQQTVKVNQIFVHENFHFYEGTSRNDIAVLVIDPLHFDEFVSPINMPPSGHEPTGSCWITGWGQTATATYTNTLYKAEVPIVNAAKCSAVYGDFLQPETQVCAGKDQGGVDACLYDTDGPLICTDLGFPYFAGIVSWGYYCAIPGHPGVYTKVSHYNNWIPPSP